VSGSLLETVQGLLTRTYALEAPLDEIGRYVIGDAGLAILYSSGTSYVRSHSGGGARLLVRENAGGLRACIYYPDAMIETLEVELESITRVS